MHLEVKVALNFIMSYLYNRLPRRRAHLFGEELERLLVARFQGHWYPEAPLRGSAFRCLHLGAPPDPLVELAARRSGLDTEEVRANVPPGLSVWIDPYEVSYQIGEKGAVKVLYLEDPRAPPGGAGEPGQHEAAGGGAELDEREGRSTGFNPEAQVFVPVGGLSSSPPSPLSCPGLGFGFPSPGLCPAPAAAPHSSSSSSSCSSSSSTPPSSASSPPLGAAHPYPALPPQAAPPLPPPALPLARPAPQPLTFTTASFAATKFGSTKMKRSGLAGTGGGGGGGGSGGGGAIPQRMARSPTNVAHSLLGKQKPLSLSLHSLGGLGSSSSSQLSPNAKEFVYPGSPGPLYFDTDAPSSHASPFQPPPPPPHTHPHPSFDPFSSPPPGSGVGLVGGGGGISSSLYMDKPAYVDSLGGYNLQYPSQAFQPVVLAN